MVERKDAELVKMQTKLDELVLSRDQHVHALEQAQGSAEATSRAADADEYEIELAKDSRLLCDRPGRLYGSQVPIPIDIDVFALPSRLLS
ncbi:hypothetical protein BJV77DRAFT_1066195 [Russula vinacea]|nr:hypothetical protein BJV77DRAFT_1066195 [Russula vinacea]